MNPAKIIIGLIIFIILIIVLGGAVYILDYLKADGGIALTLITGLASAIKTSVIMFFIILILLILGGWLLWSGTKRGSDAKK